MSRRSHTWSGLGQARARARVRVRASIERIPAAEQQLIFRHLVRDAVRDTVRDRVRARVRDRVRDTARATVQDLVGLRFRVGAEGVRRCSRHQGRYGGDMGELWGRCGGDIGRTKVLSSSGVFSTSCRLMRATFC